VYVGAVTVSDAQFRIGVVGAAVVLALGITCVRYCGSVSLPDKPPPLPTRAPEQPVEQVTASPTLYTDYLARDAAAAGVRTPTYDEMTRKLPFQVDPERHVLEIDETIKSVGLELSARRAGEALVLEIRNTTQEDLAYLVMTEVIPNVGGCTGAVATPLNAIVIGKGQTETRVECSYRAGIAIAVKRVETVALSPLSAWYVGQVPTAQLAIDPRVARGHRQPKASERCLALRSQAVRTGLENGEIVWRDLVDFYARHRCQTYQFPSRYRAFTKDRDITIPAT
jgi:hypothetical protein